jgi:hypothetical protein
MTENTASTDLPTTTLPCPPWCRLEPGHGFHSTDTASCLLVRGHERLVQEVRGTDRKGWYVTIVADERATTDHGPVVSLDPPLLSLGLDGNDEARTAGDARSLASALLDAADRLDELTRP